MLWFQGAIPAAIASAKRSGAVFVVFVAGEGGGGSSCGRTLFRPTSSSSLSSELRQAQAAVPGFPALPPSVWGMPGLGRPPALASPSTPAGGTVPASPPQLSELRLQLCLGPGPRPEGPNRVPPLRPLRSWRT